jgi:hypothetical protein
MSQKSFIVLDTSFSNKECIQLKISNTISQRPSKIIKSF